VLPALDPVCVEDYFAVKMGASKLWQTAVNVSRRPRVDDRKMESADLDGIADLLTVA
jgi:hypothetical protein